MLFSVAINVVCTILTPLAANVHYNLMVLMRILEGIGGGTTFPAMVCSHLINMNSIGQTINFVNFKFKACNVSLLGSTR